MYIAFAFIFFLAILCIFISVAVACPPVLLSGDWYAQQKKSTRASRTTILFPVLFFGLILQLNYRNSMYIPYEFVLLGKGAERFIQS